MHSDSEDSPRLALRSHSREAHDLALMACEQPPPEDIPEAAVLMRRWTRVPAHRKPEVQFKYDGISSRSTVGFLAWLVAVCGSHVFTAFRARHPVEAVEFRRQALALCAARADQLSGIGGSGATYVFSRALARHARFLPETILDDAPQKNTRHREREMKELLADKLTIFLGEARTCAHQLMASARFIQEELRSIAIAENQAEAILRVCESLIGTKHDVVDELDDLEDYVPCAGAPAARKKVERIVQWIREDLYALDAVVRASDDGGDGEPAPGSRAAFVLLAESAENVLQSFTATACAANAYEVACEDRQ